MTAAAIVIALALVAAAAIAGLITGLRQLFAAIDAAERHREP